MYVAQSAILPVVHIQLLEYENSLIETRELHLQWNSSITDNVGDQNFVHYSEVS